MDPVDPPTLGQQSITDDVVDIHGLAATSPLRTCFDLIRGCSLVEAVVVLDAFAFAGVFTLPEMDAYLQTRSCWPGVRLARTACQLATAHSRSPGESRLRMVVVLAGFPEPLVNVPFQLRDGVTFYPDLVLAHVPRPVGLEYDGLYHDDPAQQARDRRRENSLAIGTLPLLRYDSRAVLDERDRIVAEVARASGASPTSALRSSDFRRAIPSQAW